MDYLTGNSLMIASSVLAGAAMVIAFLLIRNRRKSKGDGKTLHLEEIVTLDSKGWALLAAVAAGGALIMVISAIAIGIDYWTGLAVDADMKAERIPADPKWWQYLTPGVVTFFILALFFEFVSDLGTPLASGLKQRKKKLIPELVLAATVGCIVMSLVTKWGYYDDKRSARVIAGAQIAVEDTSWETKRDEAQKLVDKLNDTPSESVAAMREQTANTKITDLRTQLEDAREARDKIPESHSTNRLKAGDKVDEIQRRLEAAESELVAVAVIRDDLARLATAKADRDEANAKIKENAGLTDGEGHSRTPAGDLLFIRALRVGLHQFLCWLLPLVFFEARAAYTETKKKEDANAKRAATRRANANTWDADFSEIDPEEDRPPLEIGADGYFEEKAEADRLEREELERLRKKQEESAPNAESSGGYDNGEGSHEQQAVNDDDDQTRKAS